MAVIFVNGLEKDPAGLVKMSNTAVLGAYRKIGLLSKKEFDVVAVHVIDVQTVHNLRYNARKFGMNNFLLTNDENNMDPMKTVLAIGPAEPDRLNKLSPNLRLF